MTNIGALTGDNVDAVVERVRANQLRVAATHPLIAAHVDVSWLAELLLSSARDVLVATRDGAVVGHLRAIPFDSQVFGRSVWINPEGLSYDDDTVLEALFVASADRALAAGHDHVYVWVPDDALVTAWFELGFSLMHRKGSMRLDDRPLSPWPAGYRVRRGSIDDLDVALELDTHLQIAQEAGPSYSLDLDDTGQREEWIETLEDPSVQHYLVEVQGAAVAQCATYALPESVGVHAHTVHLSAVSVREEHRRIGLARALVDVALDTARQSGFEYASTNWRVTNHRAARYWRDYGFATTYVRLHRHLGDN